MSDMFFKNCLLLYTYIFGYIFDVLIYNLFKWKTKKNLEDHQGFITYLQENKVENFSPYLYCMGVNDPLEEDIVMW